MDSKSGEESQVGDEESTARGLQNRDPEVWAEVYEKYFSRVYRYIAVRVGDKIDAEDLAGQVFLKALESISSFKWRGVPIAAWLFRIAHNQVIDYRRTSKAKFQSPLKESLINGDADPVLEAERSLDINQVVQAVGQLSQAQRNVIELRFAGGLSTAEVAKVLGKSQGAVKVLQHNALIALRKRLSSERNHEEKL